MLAEERRPKAVLQTFVLLLSPFAPHIAEELWQCLGNTNTLALEPWPAFETAYVQETQIEIPVQVNGKIRSRLMLPAAADREMIRQLVHELPAVIAALADKQIVREIIVPGKLVNILTE